MKLYGHLISLMGRGYAQMMGLPDPGQASVDEGLATLELCIEQFASWMKGRTYVAGAELSLADFCWAADMHEMSANMPSISVLSDARVAPWWERISARTSWTAAI